MLIIRRGTSFNDFLKANVLIINKNYEKIQLTFAWSMVNRPRREKESQK